MRVKVDLEQIEELSQEKDYWKLVAEDTAERLSEARERIQSLEGEIIRLNQNRTYTTP